MKTSYKKMALMACFGTLAMTASAQHLRSAYFSDSHLYRHEMNPAMGNMQSYFSLPGFFGNMNMQMGSNFGISDLIYANPDKSSSHKLTTFMDEKIPASTVLGNLEDISKMRLQGDYTLFSMGIKTQKAYHTFEVGSHFNAGVNLPKSLFEFMKEMKSNTKYDFGEMQANGRCYLDISYGYSRDIVYGIRVGAKVKYLMGVFNAQADFTDCHASLYDNKWTMSMNGTVDVAADGGAWKQGDNYGGGRYEATGYKLDKVKGLAGSGFAVDLGATWDADFLVPGLKASLALTDIGSIKWKKNVQAKADGKDFVFDGFKEISTAKSSENSLSNQWDDIEDQLKDMYRLSTDGKETTLKDKLGMTLTAGVEYELPRYKKISFGALYTKRFSDYYDYSEIRGVVNYAPSRIFDLALSGAFSEYGPAFGASLNLACSGFSIFLAGDLYCGKINKNHVPLEKSNSSISLGINFPLGFKDKD